MADLSPRPASPSACTAASLAWLFGLPTWSMASRRRKQGTAAEWRGAFFFAGKMSSCCMRF